MKKFPDDFSETIQKKCHLTSLLDLLVATVSIMCATSTEAVTLCTRALNMTLPSNHCSHTHRSGISTRGRVGGITQPIRIHIIRVRTASCARVLDLAKALALASVPNTPTMNVTL